MTHNLYLYVTHFYDRKPSGPESGPILSPVPDVIFDLYKSAGMYRQTDGLTGRVVQESLDVGFGTKCVL